MLGKLLCRFGFHKWKYVYRIVETLFLGERIREKWVRFRICERCGKVQVWTPYTLGREHFIDFLIKE